MMPWKTRYVTIHSGNNAGVSSQIRVNIAYERDMVAPASQEEESPVRTETPPPVLAAVEEGFRSPSSVPAMAKEEIVRTNGEEFKPEKNQLKMATRVLKREAEEAEPVETKRVFRITSGQETFTQEPNYVDERWNPAYINNASVKEEYPEYIEDYEQDDAGCSQDTENKTSKIPVLLCDCRICGATVHPQLRKQHIFMKHLRKKIYKCPFCDIGHVYHKGNIEQHIRKAHNSRAKAISIKDNFTNEVDVWMYKCFTDRRLMRFIDPDVVETVTKLIEWASTGVTLPPRHVETTPSQNIFDDQLPEELLEDEVVDEVLEPAPPSSPPKAVVPVTSQPMKSRKNVTCQLCGMTNIKHLERHVLQHHLKRATFLCPFCQYSSNYAANTVKDHIRTKHIVTDQETIDLRAEHWPDIRKLYDQCFLPQNQPPLPSQQPSQATVFYPVWRPTKL